jgi:hypothetical protein
MLGRLCLAWPRGFRLKLAGFVRFYALSELLEASPCKASTFACTTPKYIIQSNRPYPIYYGNTHICGPSEADRGEPVKDERTQSIHFLKKAPGAHHSLRGKAFFDCAGPETAKARFLPRHKLRREQPRRRSRAHTRHLVGRPPNQSGNLSHLSRISHPHALLLFSPPRGCQALVEPHIDLALADGKARIRTHACPGATRRTGE